MLSKNIISSLALLALLGFAFCLADDSSNLATPQEQLWAIDTKLDDGTTIKYPFFDNSIQEISEDLRLLQIKQMNEILTYITTVVTNELDNPGSTGFMGWLKAGKNLISMGYSQRNERTKLKQPFPKDKEFNTFMSNMFKGYMVQSKERASTMPKESRADLRKRLIAYTGQLKKAIELSKVGPYMKMDDAFINDQTFSTLTVDVMASMRNNGFEKFLGSIDTLMGIIALFK